MALILSLKPECHEMHHKDRMYVTSIQFICFLHELISHAQPLNADNFVLVFRKNLWLQNPCEKEACFILLNVCFTS